MVASAKAAPKEAGDVWTWTGVDADSKLIVSYLVGDRSGQAAIELMDDLRARLADRVQITTDGQKAYLETVEGAFGDRQLRAHGRPLYPVLLFHQDW